MKKRLLVLLLSLASLTLVSCGGGNDVASSGASVVSAAAPLTTTTEPKVNGQIDERTGVAPVAAQATIWTPLSNGGCGKSSTFRREVLIFLCPYGLTHQHVLLMEGVQ